MPDRMIATSPHGEGSTKIASTTAAMKVNPYLPRRLMRYT
jgi:hypothetical protein